MRLTFDKRYITLAPVATMIGLAFRMYDPDKLLGDKEDLGITLALRAARNAGLEIGRRHFPLNAPFQNGPIHGKDVFVPLSQLIGGADMAGQGWRMLVECLSVGRSITLPSTASGASRMAAVGDRRLCAHPQAVRPVDRPLRGRGGSAGAHRRQHLRDQRAVAGHGRGRGSRREAGGAVGDRQIPLHRDGPRGRQGRDGHARRQGRHPRPDATTWAAAGRRAPIAITVEGANIMTRSLMIFGQGAIRCHPWVLKEMQAARHRRLPQAPATTFDTQLFGHIGFAISNAVRSFVFGLTVAQHRRARRATPTRAATSASSTATRPRWR